MNILNTKYQFKSHKDSIYRENIDILLKILNVIKKELENIFKYENYHKFEI